MPLPLVTANAVQLRSRGVDLGIADQVAYYAAALLVCCMCCRWRLSRSRPASDQLMLCLLATSLDSALGGLFVAIVARALFKNLCVLTIRLVDCNLLLGAVVTPTGRVWAAPAQT